MERLDRTAFRVTTLDDESHDREFWWSKTQAERLAAMQYLRRINYGSERTAARLQRVLRVVELGE
ncbi:MAG: hypothetical protein AAF805_05560, partial [Planctomycetota bacterium]